MKVSTTPILYVICQSLIPVLRNYTAIPRIPALWLSFQQRLKIGLRQIINDVGVIVTQLPFRQTSSLITSRLRASSCQLTALPH